MGVTKLFATAVLLAMATSASAVVQTVEYSGSLQSTSTNQNSFGGVMMLAGFDSSLGTLIGVSVVYSAAYDINGVARSYASGPTSFTQTHNIHTTFMLGDATSYQEDAAAIAIGQSYANLAAGSSAAYGPFLDRLAGGSFTVAAADWTNDTDVWVNLFTGYSGVYSGTPGDAQVSFDITRDAAATITYTYDNAILAGGVPEPASWTMMIVGFGTVGFAMRRKSHGQRVPIACA